MSDASELLERARAAYLQGQANYRDALLETGRLLHEYILARLREGDGFGKDKRLALGLCRQKVVDAAGDALGVSSARVHRLLVAAQVVTLLGGGEPGGLGYITVCRFQVLIRRYRGTSQDKANRPGGHPLSAEETWAIKPGLEEKAPALFRRAVAEGWSQDRALLEVARLFRAPTKAWRRERRHRQALEQLQAAARHAASGDVAEMCLDLLRAAEDPWAVAQRLLPELQRIRRPLASAAG